MPMAPRIAPTGFFGAISFISPVIVPFGHDLVLSCFGPLFDWPAI